MRPESHRRTAPGRSHTRRNPLGSVAVDSMLRVAFLEGTGGWIVWASDYPHPDAKIPGVVNEFETAVKPLPRVAQTEVLGASARRFYQL